MATKFTWLRNVLVYFKYHSGLHWNRICSSLYQQTTVSFQVLNLDIKLSIYISMPFKCYFIFSGSNYPTPCHSLLHYHHLPIGRNLLPLAWPLLNLNFVAHLCETQLQPPPPPTHLNLWTLDLLLSNVTLPLVSYHLNMSTNVGHHWRIEHYVLLLYVLWTQWILLSCEEWKNQQCTKTQHLYHFFKRSKTQRKLCH